MDDWFEVEGAEEDEFLRELRSRARSWPSIPTTEPIDTGGWLRTGFLITYADRDDAEHRAVLASFRVDFDGTRALAARVSPGYVEVGSFFGELRPEGDEPVELCSGSPRECGAAAAEWFQRRLTS